MTVYKYFSLILLFIFYSCISLTQAAELNQGDRAIHWQIWSPALFTKAKSEHKLIFIYGKVKWCHWCQKMNDSTFTDPNLAEAINENYIPIRVDIEEEPDIASYYRITEIPTLIILDVHGQELKRFYGYYSSSSLFGALQRLVHEYLSKQ